MFVFHIEEMKLSCTSERRSSTEAAENVGTRSEPLTIVAMKCFPDSANSHVMQAAERKMICK